MTEAKKLRRTSACGYARGDETRRRIIESAIELFGERGFAGASTREIAAHAGVNAPALQYYFENKEGVFRACVDAIAEHAVESFGPAIEHGQAMLDQDADVETLIDAFLGIMLVISNKMFDTPKTARQRMFFAREQAGLEPPFVSEILMERFRRPLNTVCAQLVGRISGMDPKHSITQIRTISLLGQLTVFHLAHRSALTLLGWQSFQGANGELLKATLDDQIRSLLRQWHRERGVAGEPADPPAAKAKPAKAAKAPRPAAAPARRAARGGKSPAP